MLGTMNSESLYFDILKQFPGLIVVMDTDSKFIYSNHYTANMFGYSTTDAMQGIDAFQMRCPASESAAEFISQDKIVIHEGKELSILDIHTYANNQPKILLTKKKPLIQDGEVRGVICYCTELQSNALTQVCAAITQADKKYYVSNKSVERSYLVGETKTECLLTQREREVVFYMLRGQTVKQIAKSMNISPRTVETYKENIKLKWTCTLTSEIIDKAISSGYLTYLPNDLLSKELTCVLAMKM